MNMKANLKYRIGLDVGGTSIRAAIVDTSGHIIGPFVDEKRERETPTHISNTIRFLLEFAAREGLEIVHIGLAIAGLVDPVTHILVTSTTILEMEGMDVSEWVRRVTDIPFIITNDANAAGYGEWKSGAAAKYKNCIALFIGTGIGGALILNGQLVTGVDGVAGEVGHMIMDPKGPSCSCGGRGCLEQLASGTAISRFVERAIQSGEETVLRSLFSQQGGLSGEDIAAAALKGDEVALSTYRKAGFWLGAAIATLANLLNPDSVILSGGVMAVDALLMPSLLQAKEHYTMKVQGKRLHIAQGVLGRQAGVLGAADLATQSMTRDVCIS